MRSRPRTTSATVSPGETNSTSTTRSPRARTTVSTTPESDHVFGRGTPARASLTTRGDSVIPPCVARRKMPETYAGGIKRTGTEPPDLRGRPGNSQGAEDNRVFVEAKTEVDKRPRSRNHEVDRRHARGRPQRRGCLDRDKARLDDEALGCPEQGVGRPACHEREPGSARRSGQERPRPAHHGRDGLEDPTPTTPCPNNLITATELVWAEK